MAAAAATATSVATSVTASSSDSRFDEQLDASMGEREVGWRRQFQGRLRQMLALAAVWL